jgi:hypothetical protein
VSRIVFGVCIICDLYQILFLGLPYTTVYMYILVAICEVSRKFFLGLHDVGVASLVFSTFT